MNNFRYADDTVLMAESENDRQEVLNEVKNTGKLYGMKMNAKKTKTMVVTRKEETSEINIEIDGCNIDQVNNFKYLGQTITDDGRCEKAIIKWIEIVRKAFNNFGKSLIMGSH